MINSPCYQCTERHYNCHGECDKYAQYKNTIAISKQSESKFDERTVPTRMLDALDRRRKWNA